MTTLALLLLLCVLPHKPQYRELYTVALLADHQVDLWNFFVDKTRENLHVVLCFSPIGDAFRDRLRQFPSLVNCCTIDW
jgi:hypothetical protein